MKNAASMATIDSVSREYPGAGASRLLLRTVLERYGPRDFALELWDGEHWPAQLGNRPRFELILRVTQRCARPVQPARFAEFWRSLCLQPAGY
jgi:hypothetical protein